MAYIREYPLNVTSLKWSSLTTFDDFRDPPPPPSCLHFPSEFEWSPLWIVLKIAAIPLLGSQLRQTPPSPPPPPLLFSNSASFSTKGIKRDIICFYRARLLCETAHRGTTRNLRNRRNLKKKWLFLLQIPLANVTKQLVTIHGIIDRLFTVPYYQQRSSRSSAHRLGATLFKYTDGAGLGVPKPPRKVPSARQPGSAVPPSAVPHISLTRCYRRDR